MNSLDAERVLDYFLNASSDGFNGKISSVPPALPTEGQVFVFDLGPDKSLWENNKRKFRLMVGLPPNIHGQPNILNYNEKKAEKRKDPPGRKNPEKRFKQEDKRSNTNTCTGPEDVLQGSPTLNASPSPRMPPAAIDDIPHASFSNENNAPSNVVIEGDSQSTYLSILCQGKSLNVNCNRQLYNSANDTGFDNISWNEYLTKINILFPDILAASYVCEATYYKVISTYMAPDRSELNYHAGIAVRSHGVIEVTVKHCGVQFIESEEDILLAGLVFHACYQPESDLSKTSTPTPAPTLTPTFRHQLLLLLLLLDLDSYSCAYSYSYF
eukprot:Em0375g1a